MTERKPFLLDERIFTSRLMLQRLRPEDAEEVFYGYASKPEVTRFLTWPTHNSLADTRSFLAYADQAWRRGQEFSFGLRLKINNRLIGAFGARHDEGRMEIGYVLGPAFWRQGLATEACTGMVNYFRTLPHVYRIQSFVDEENVPSARVLLKSGFIEEARLPKWRRFVNLNNAPRDCIQFRVPLS
jgi:ribosomal-protein-alanine N-acetyltransferase